MPTLNEISSYELGIRLTQALILLSADGCGPNTEIEAALMRLQSSAARASERLREDSDRLALVAKSCLDRWDLVFIRDRDEMVCEELKKRLLAARQYNMDFLDQCHPGLSPWFRLGLVIADGSDESWSDGTPQIVQGYFPDGTNEPNRPRCGTLEFKNPVPPNWEWRHARLITELIAQLGQSDAALFPAQSVLNGRECQYFAGLTFKHFWGWHAIELGLAALAGERITPRWDEASKKLYLAGDLIHTYKSTTGNQVSILRSFQARSWPDSIECPFDDCKKASVTLFDLNNAMARSSLRFQGGINGISWYLESVLEGQ